MTDLSSLQKAFSNFADFSEREIALITGNATIEKISRKTKMLVPDEVCKRMYFVLSGCLRLYYAKPDGHEVNCFFFHEGLFCTAFGSFMKQRKSNQYLETIEDSVCISISHEELEQLYILLPIMNVMVRKILEERYTNAHEIISSYILDNPETRYLKFRMQYPLLINRLPEYHIASYLGITPKSLSRLKKRIAKKR
jgi:CRP-like cAMP-binding protein